MIHCLKRDNVLYWDNVFDDMEMLNNLFGEGYCNHYIKDWVPVQTWIDRYPKWKIVCQFVDALAITNWEQYERKWYYSVDLSMKKWITKIYFHNKEDLAIAKLML